MKYNNGRLTCKNGHDLTLPDARLHDGRCRVCRDGVREDDSEEGRKAEWLKHLVADQQKALRALIRLKHSQAADEDIRRLLPELRKALVRRAQWGIGEGYDLNDLDAFARGKPLPTRVIPHEEAS